MLNSDQKALSLPRCHWRPSTVFTELLRRAVSPTAWRTSNCSSTPLKCRTLSPFSRAVFCFPRLWWMTGSDPGMLGAGIYFASTLQACPAGSPSRASEADTLGSCWSPRWHWEAARTSARRCWSSLSLLRGMTASGKSETRKTTPLHSSLPE